MMNEQNAIELTLSCAAEDCEDFNQRFYQKFYQLEPHAQSLMSHIDEGVQGKMMAEIFRLFLAPAVAETESEYLLFEMKNHTHAYFVPPEMYRGLNQALFETLKSAASRVWSDEIERAVQNRLNAMLTAIASALAVGAP